MEETQIEQVQILKELAEAIRSRRLESPAIFFLEMHKPLFGLAQGVATMSMPLITLFFGAKKSEIAHQLLQDSKNVDRLLKFLEGRD